jgi:hypothetical protein
MELPRYQTLYEFSWIFNRNDEIKSKITIDNRIYLDKNKAEVEKREFSIQVELQRAWKLYLVYISELQYKAIFGKFAMFQVLL